MRKHLNLTQMVSIKWNFHCTPTHTNIDTEFSLMQEIFATISKLERAKMYNRMNGN